MTRPERFGKTTAATATPHIRPKKFLLLCRVTDDECCFFFFLRTSRHRRHQQALMKQVCEILGEVEPTLAASGGVPEGSGEQAVLSAKQCLLELWHHLLDSVERVPASEVNPVMFSVVLGVMRRPEFDVSHLHLDVHMRPTCEVHDVMLAFRYRRLLFATMAYVARVLGAAADSESSSLPLDGAGAAAVAAATERMFDTSEGSLGVKKKAHTKSASAPSLSPPPQARWAVRSGGGAAIVAPAREEDDEGELEVLDVVEVHAEGTQAIPLSSPPPQPPRVNTLLPTAAAAVPSASSEPASLSPPTSPVPEGGPACAVATTVDKPAPPLEIEQHPVVVDEVAAKEQSDGTAAPSQSEPQPQSQSQPSLSPPPPPQPPTTSLMTPPAVRKRPTARALTTTFTTFASKALALLFFRLPR
jgi:hypothetical protein